VNPSWIAAQTEALLAQRGHAWLLQGPSGLGQYSLALEMVRAWLCDSPTPQGACGQCASCHTPPYYTDNLMHNLKVERFFKEVTINGRRASADGPIKTFPLRGIKDSPPYLHDDRLLTLDDTVEFFNLVLETKLNEQEKKDLVAFMRAL